MPDPNLLSAEILVFFDTIVVPITLGWPHLMAKGTFLSTFYQAQCGGLGQR